MACVVFHRTNFVWTKDHDIFFCRELLVTEPYAHKVRSVERAKAWEQIASSLNSIQAPKFRVTTRSVRDRYTLLTTRKAEQLREEEKALGIEVTPTEIDLLLEEILEKEKAARAEIESGDTKKRKAEQDKAGADNIRRLAMERMSQTKTRESDVGETSSKKKKTRRSSHEMLEFLENKSERDHQMKQELNLRRSEQEAMTAMMRQQQQQLQNLQAMFVSQQTQQTQAMLALLEKVVKK